MCPELFFNLLSEHLQNAPWTSQQTVLFLDAKIVKMRPKHFCKCWRRI